MRKLLIFLFVLMMVGHSTSNAQTRFVRAINNISDLVSAQNNPAQIHTNIFLSGYATDTDEGGGIFEWIPGSTTSTNLGTVFRSQYPGANGRYKRQYSGSLHVRWFGAKGDDVTDDYAAFNNAIATAPPGEEIIISQGSYVIASDLMITNKVTLRGDAPWHFGSTTKLRYTGNNILLHVQMRGVTVEGLALFTASGTTAIKAYGVEELVVKNCFLYGWSYRMIDTDSYWHRIDNTSFQAIANGVVGIYGRKDFNQNVISQCGFTAAPGIDWTPIEINGIGVGLGTSSGSSIIYNDFSGGGTSSYAIIIHGGSYGMNITGNRIETFGSSGIKIEEDSFGQQIIGNDIQGSSTIHAPIGITLSGGDHTLMGNLFTEVDLGIRLETGARRVQLLNNYIGSTVSPLLTNLSSVPHTITISTGEKTQLPTLEVRDNIRMASDSSFNFSTNTDTAGVTDLSLIRISPRAGLWHSGTNSAFWLTSKRYVSDSNYDAFQIGSDATNYYIGPTTSGGLTYPVHIINGGLERWVLETSGDLRPFASNAVVIGTATSPVKDLVVGTSIYTPKVHWGVTGSTFDSFGTGSPEGSVAADPGSIYRNLGGGAGTSIWVKESGTGTTGWINYFSTNSSSGSTVTNAIISINGSTNSAQYIALGSYGTDFNLGDTNDTHTINLPHSGSGIRGSINWTDSPTWRGVHTFEGATAGLAKLSFTVTNDSNSRLDIRDNGALFWGPGNTASDTSLYRSGVAGLTMDAALILNGSLFVNNNVAQINSLYNPGYFQRGKTNISTGSANFSAIGPNTVLWTNSASTTIALLSVPTNESLSFSFATIGNGVATNGFTCSTHTIEWQTSQITTPANGVLTSYDFWQVGTRLFAYANTAGGSSFTTGNGVTNIANVLSANLLAGTNTVLTTNANGVVQINSTASGTSFTTGAGVTNIANVVSWNSLAGTNIVFTTNANGVVSINSTASGTSTNGAGVLAFQKIGAGTDHGYLSTFPNYEKIAFGTSGPSFTLTNAGTYQILLNVAAYDAGTFNQRFYLTNVSDNTFVQSSAVVFPTSGEAKAVFLVQVTTTAANKNFELWGATVNSSYGTVGVIATNTVLDVLLLQSGSGGSGTITGPVSSTDNAIVRWDGTAGTTIQNSVVTINDTTGNIKIGDGSQTQVTITGDISGTDTVMTLSGGSLSVGTGTLTAGQLNANNSSSGSVTLGSLSGAVIWPSRGSISSTTNGYITLRDTAGTNFYGLRLGPDTTTNSVLLLPTNGVLRVMNGNQSLMTHLEVLDQVYGPAWDGSSRVPNQNAVWDKIESMSVGGAPGGSVTQVQFNDGGVFGGDSGLTYAKSTDTLTTGTIVIGGTNLVGELADKQPLDSDLTAVAGLSTAGIMVRTGAGTFATRDFQVGTNMVLVNSDGVAGNPSIATSLNPTFTSVTIGTTNVVGALALTSTWNPSTLTLGYSNYVAAALTNYYVSPTGLTNNTGLSPSSPWPMQMALDRLDPGITVIAMPGLYTNGYTIYNRFGASTNPATLRSQYKWKAVIANAPTFGLDIYNTPETAQYIVIDGMSISNSTTTGIKIQTPNNIIRNCWVNNNYSASSVDAIASTSNGSSNNIIEYNLLERVGNSSHGLYISGMNNIVRGNVVRNNQGFGILLYTADTGVKQWNNKVYNNLSYGHTNFYGFSIWGAFDPSGANPGTNFVFGNTIVDGMQVGFGTLCLSNNIILPPVITANPITISGGHIPTFVANYNFGTNAMGGAGGASGANGANDVTNAVTRQSIFVDISQGRYDLTASSAANTGEASGVFAPVDFYGNAQTSILNFGAFQYTEKKAAGTRNMLTTTGDDYWNTGALNLDPDYFQVVGQSIRPIVVAPTFDSITNALALSGDTSKFINGAGGLTTPPAGSSAPTNTVVSLSTPATDGGVGYASGTPGTNQLFSVGVKVAATTNLTVSGRIIESADAAVSEPSFTMTGLWYSGGSATTTKPKFLIESTGATSSNWATGGTGLGINAASGFAGSLIEVQLNGATRMTLSASGNATLLGSVTTGVGGRVLVNTRGGLGASADGAFNLQNTGATGATSLLLGVDDASPDAAVTLRAANGVGTDIVSGGWIIATGTTTGTGKPASIALKTSGKATSTSSTANTLKTRLHIEGNPAALTDNTATLVFNLALASGKYAGGRLLSTTYATDGTDHQINTSSWLFSAANKAGTVTTQITPQSLGISAPGFESILATTGTLTNGWTAVANGNSIDFKCTAKTGLTTTTYTSNWTLELQTNDAGTIVSQ